MSYDEDCNLRQAIAGGGGRGFGGCGRGALAPHADPEGVEYAAAEHEVGTDG